MIKYDDPAYHWYIILKGTVQVYVPRPEKEIEFEKQLISKILKSVKSDSASKEKLDLEILSNAYSEEDFDRYFRRVYQHFGSPRGYKVLDDAEEFLASAWSSDDLLLGITSNTPTRHMESVLPMLDIDHKFQWFTCSQDVGHEKPSTEIFADSLAQARFWLPDLQASEILHIGDSLACDYCGAKAFGFQALLLDRSDNPSVTAYQDWIAAPDYPGKSAEDIEAHTITSLLDIQKYLAM